MRRRTFWVGGVLVLTFTLVGTLILRDQARRNLRVELDQAARDLDAGYLGLAFKRLDALADAWPNDPEVNYRLGLCELARGRRDEALAAWARVPPGSAFSALAAEKRGSQLINMGRYSLAETVLEQAVGMAGGLATPEAEALRRALNRLYRFEGRVADVRRLLRSTWPRNPKPVDALKELWFLDYTPQPVASWALALSRADAEDDRVWLGKASVAILEGDHAAASTLLEECARKRPLDPAVWRARLELALASGDEAGVWDALERLPARDEPDSEPQALAAWVAGHRGDAEAERRALEALVAADPSRFAALERLAELQTRAGRLAEAAATRQRKAKLDEAKNRFRVLLLSGDALATHAAEMAQLTATLGREFDAWAWDRVAKGNPAGETWPGEPSDANTLASTDTLAHRLAALGLHPPAPAEAASAGSSGAKTGPTAPVFTDDAAEAGLANFVFDNGKTPLFQLPETMSGGVGLLDFDGDGWLDVYAVQGGPLDGSGTGDRLFRNTGDGAFEDVTERAGLAAFARGYGHGVAVADFDNDGHPDVFVTRLATYSLYRNKGDGAFEDVTDRAGLAGRRDAPSSAAFGDLDGDGDLDLYVAHYMIWDPEHPTLCPTEKGNYFYCDPSKVARGEDHAFRNDGGRFVDVTREAGFTDPDGRGLGVVIADLDGDGRCDVYVANDGTANYLFMNRGSWKFEEMGHAAGVAGNAEGGYQASMGVACGDADGDGRPDLVVTNFYGESSAFYQNLGGGLFAERGAASGIGTATRYLLGFGTAFVDHDNDGILDLLTANGHVNDNRPYYLHAMPAQLLAGLGDGRFADVSTPAGGIWSTQRVGRGLAVGDLDNDGRVDAILLAQNEPLAYFHNRVEGGGSLTLLLEGTKSNRDAIGAVVSATTPDGKRRSAFRVGGGSYQSAAAPHVHLGLGTAPRADTVEVRWPSGQVDTHRDIPAGARLRLREGTSTPMPLGGRKPR